MVKVTHSRSPIRDSCQLRKSLPFHTGEFPITCSAGNLLENCMHLIAKTYAIFFKARATNTVVFALTLYTHHSSTMERHPKNYINTQAKHLASASASRPGNHKEKQGDPSKCPGKCSSRIQTLSRSWSCRMFFRMDFLAPSANR